ncbi:hypothetical protein KCG53_03485 [Neisseria subflava]|uniref:PRTase-CE domain-containing protein n=1 Tax=Neisseria subflava TaxID=28449 RepID=A0A9X9N7A1_NEISU|nr:hypothetical protein KCG53_03485 [Neisseria subflava]
MDQETKLQLCTAIADIIRDYRNLNLDVAHVEKWINQFNIDEQEIVLRGSLHLFERLYFSESVFDRFVCDVQKYFAKISIEDYSLLDCQMNGSSQQKLNDKFIRQNGNHEINKAKRNIVYLDDFIFTGNRIENDIANLFQKNNLFGIQNEHTIHIATLGYFSYGQYKLEQSLREMANGMNRKVLFTFPSYEKYRLVNNPNKLNEADVFCISSAILESNQDIKKFLKDDLIGRQDLRTRDENNSQIAFNGFPWRDDFERILIKHGIEIIQMCQQHSQCLKPLGYGSFPLDLVLLFLHIEIAQIMLPWFIGGFIRRNS